MRPVWFGLSVASIVAGALALSDGILVALEGTSVFPLKLAARFGVILLGARLLSHAISDPS